MMHISTPYYYTNETNYPQFSVKGHNVKSRTELIPGQVPEMNTDLEKPYL